MAERAPARPQVAVTGAVALAIVLVIAVAGLSLAMQSQRTAQSPQHAPAAPRPPSAHATASHPRSEGHASCAGRDAAAAGTPRTRGPGDPNSFVRASRRKPK